MEFEQLDINPALKKAIAEKGYRELTPIQESTFGPITEGKDLLGLAKTGSGKTGACAIPLLEIIDLDIREIQALIIVPTRELALQYTLELDQFSKHMDIEILAAFGGLPMADQQRALADGVHILVATPGRLIDHIYSSKISFRELKAFVLDEADEMLNMGFIEDIEFVLSCIVHQHQILLFSATMPPVIEKLAGKHLKDPVKVKLIEGDSRPAEITHYFVQSSFREKINHTLDYLKDNDCQQTLIFCNSRRAVEQTYDHLKRQTRQVEFIHGGLEQIKRLSIFERVKSKRIRVLIATDVAGRGLDFTHITHIINYDFPREVEAFTHRTGRTGRMGRKGETFSLITRRDEPVMQEVLDALQIKPLWYEKNKKQAPVATKSPKPSRDHRQKQRQGSKPKHNPVKKSKPRAKSPVKSKPQSKFQDSQAKKGGLVNGAKKLWDKLFW
jgi:ATP-dependent RNA helicase DeaD